MRRTHPSGKAGDRKSARGPGLIERLGQRWRTVVGRLRARLGERLEGRDPGPADERPDLGLQRRTLDAELARRASGEIDRLLRDLDGHPFERQLLLVRELRGYEGALVVRELCARSRAALGDNATRARELALLAVDVAKRLDGRSYPDGLVGDLLGVAWIRVGFAERRASNLLASESALQEAKAALESGSGDALEWAKLHHAIGMLRMDQGKLREALRSSERAAGLYEEMGNWHSLGKVILDQGLILQEMGEFEGACRKFIASSLLLDERAEPRLVLAVVHNLALGLAGLGRPAAALEILGQAAPLYESLGTRSDALRRIWTEGTILVEQGWPSWRQAAGKFREARAGFLEQGWVLEAARLSLEEALISDPERRRLLIAELLGEMVPVLRVRGLRQEALVALALLEETVRGEIEAAAIEAAIRALSRERPERALDIDAGAPSER